MNRDLDSSIAKEVFNWRYIQVSPDINGENACEVLFSPAFEPGQDHYSMLPNKGKPHEGFFCPDYSTNLITAIRFAQHVQMPLTIDKMPLNPEELSQMALDFFRQKKSIALQPSTNENKSKS